MTRALAQVLREHWDIAYLHSSGRAGSALLDALARGGAAGRGTVVAFTTLPGAGEWTVVACIPLDQGPRIFGRVLGDGPWTPRAIRRRMRGGLRPAAVPAVGEVGSIADVAFVLTD